MPPKLDKILISKEQLCDRIATLGKTITLDYKDCDNLVCIGILKGSFIFTADLVRKINHHNLTVDFMSISSYGDEATTSGTVKINLDLSKDISGKHILIIEDIIDSGLTIKYLVNLLNQRKPASIKVCSLLKKDNPNVLAQMDYFGFTIANDAFVVGYGLDYAQQYRHLDYIASMTN